MTEKNRQSTVQPEQTQGFASPAEDELDFIDLLKILARKKVFILAIMFICTLFSIFYAQSITPVYRATVGLLDHNESFSSSSVLEQLGLSDEIGHNTKSLNIFERFLFNVRSYELKQEVLKILKFIKKKTLFGHIRSNILTILAKSKKKTYTMDFTIEIP